jgi:hypothetical protein
MICSGLFIWPKYNFLGTIWFLFPLSPVQSSKRSEYILVGKRKVPQAVSPFRFQWERSWCEDLYGHPYKKDQNGSSRRNEAITIRWVTACWVAERKHFGRFGIGYSSFFYSFIQIRSLIEAPHWEAIWTSTLTIETWYRNCLRMFPDCSSPIII